MYDFISARSISLLALMLIGAGLTGCGSSGGSGEATLPPDTEPEELACTEFAPAGSTAAPVREGLLCTLLSGVVCNVGDATLAIDGDAVSATHVAYRVGLLDELLGGAAGIRATLPGPISAGRLAAVDIDLGAGVLDVALGRTVTISTWRNGVKQEERGTGTLLSLDLLASNILGNEGRGLVGFVNTLPYDELQVTISANLLSLDLLESVRIHEVCLFGEPRD